MIKQRIIALTLGALCVAAAFTGCKTTEKNYREAYEMAKDKQTQTGGVDSTIYANLRKQGKPAVIAVGGDSLVYRTVTIGFPKDCGASHETVKRYNIVVGQFKQIFNARAMRQRLLDGGYDGALVLQTREPLYYVVATSVATPEEALAALKRVKADGSLSLRDPMPWVLRPSHLAR